MNTTLTRIGVCLLTIGWSHSLFSSTAEPKDIFELGLEELMHTKVSVASLTEETIAQTPGIVSVITGEELKKMGAKHVGDVLDMLPGVEYRADYIGYDETKFRGIGTPNFGSQILGLLDGVTLNDPFIGTTVGHLLYMPLDDISRIEIIRGPGSALYGGNALAGVIDIKTKTAEDVDGFEARARYGRFNHKGAQLLFGKKSGEFKIFASFDYDKEDGKGETVKRDYLTLFDTRYRIPYGLAPFSLAPRRIVYFYEREQGKLLASYKNWNVDLFYYDYGFKTHVGQLGAFVDKKKDNHHTGRFSFHVYTHFQNNNIKLTPSLQRTWYGYTDKTRVTLLPPFMLDVNGDGDLEDFTQEGMRASWTTPTTRLVANLRFEYTGFNKHHIFLLPGYEYLTMDDPHTVSNSHMQTLEPLGQMVDWSDTPLNGNKEAHRRILSLSVQDKISLKDTLSLTLGMRLDKYDDMGRTTNPRVALVWSPNSVITTKVLYGTAFRPPNFNELYSYNIILMGNSNIKSETIKSYEAAIFVDPKWKRSLFSVNAFYNQYNKAIEPSSSGAGVNTYQNSAQKNFWGGEAEYRMGVTDRLTGKLTYSYLEGKHKDTKLPVRNLSKHKSSLEVNYKFLQDFNFNVTSFYLSKKHRESGDTRKSLKSFLIWNSAFTYQKGPVDVSLAVHNLFNTKHFSPSIPERGIVAVPDDIPRRSREALLKVGYNFHDMGVSP